jgi:hypothetical protein
MRRFCLGFLIGGFVMLIQGAQPPTFDQARTVLKILSSTHDGANYRLKLTPYYGSVTGLPSSLPHARQVLEARLKFWLPRRHHDSFSDLLLHLAYCATMQSMRSDYEDLPQDQYEQFWHDIRSRSTTLGAGNVDTYIAVLVSNSKDEGVQC